MPVFLFDNLIFGPVYSRRLGKSLGVNLLPIHAKECSFNCIYCECGWTKNRNALKMDLPTPEDVYEALEKRLTELIGTDSEPDSITFAGNGEPTMHPQFAEIIEDVIALRNNLLPSAKISVLSNGSMLHKHQVIDALKLVDNNIQKLDGGNEAIIKLINMPLKAFKLKEYVEQLKRIRKNLIIQTLFLRGKLNEKTVDNCQPAELNDWLNLLKQIQPKAVMLYSLDRDTPAHDLEKISEEELHVIAQKVNEIGIEASVFG
jgi:wyosine [tRNA(Phe)-imidazoG37] synthetase (radical SAM superfamily)